MAVNAEAPGSATPKQLLQAHDSPGKAVATVDAEIDEVLGSNAAFSADAQVCAVLYAKPLVLGRPLHKVI